MILPDIFNFFYANKLLVCLHAVKISGYYKCAFRYYLSNDFLFFANKTDTIHEHYMATVQQTV